MSNQWSVKDSQDRKDKFVKAYDLLVTQYDVALMAFPQLVPSGQQGFNIAASMVAMDKRNVPVPSPLQAEGGLAS